jgi:hypothetical protein
MATAMTIGVLRNIRFMLHLQNNVDSLIDCIAAPESADYIFM